MRTLRKVAPYVLVVVASWVGSALYADQIERGVTAETNRSITTNYWNSVDACIRGNETVRLPLHDFFAVFYTDESAEHDDPEVEVAARIVRNKTVPQQCVTIIERPEGADAYVPEDLR